MSRLMIFVLPCFNGVTFKVVYEDSRDQHLPTLTVRGGGTRAEGIILSKIYLFAMFPFLIAV